MLARSALCSPHRSLTLTPALLLLALAPACLAAGESSGKSKAAPVSADKVVGWQVLFDGTSTDGWRGFKRKGFPAKGWVIEEDCLKVQAGGGGGDLMTAAQYSDFDLSLEWKVSPGANSGIIFGVTEDEDAPWKTGPEYQIFDDADHNTDPTDPHSAGSLYALYAPEGKTLKPVGEFNLTRILLKDGRLTHFLNGTKIVQAEVGSDDWNERIRKSKFNAFSGFGKQAKGHIVLQDHGHDVWFRNIKIRDLTQPMPGEVSLFNGRDLDGWAAYSQDGSTLPKAWLVEDGLLKTMGSPAGYLYTKKEYESFVLRLEWRFNPETRKAGNGGVLLRMTGEHTVWPNSVEAQLHSTNAGDFWNIGKYPMKVNEERTNGRNTKKTHFAENPVGEWNEYEIVVDKTDITLMVNGEVVNNAWDVKVQPGRICLQAEGSEMHFRNIRLAEIK